jgi:hypothetical protein
VPAAGRVGSPSTDRANASPWLRLAQNPFPPRRRSGARADAYPLTCEHHALANAPGAAQILRQHLLTRARGRNMVSA